MKYQAFTAHLPLDQYDCLEEKLQEYNIGAYIIAHETTPFSHFHFCVQMEDKEYHNFCQAIFKKKYNLRGRAIKDKPRQYGKLTTINAIEKMKSYTVKDGNYRTNLSHEEITEIYNNSYQKVDKKKEIEKLFDFLEKQEFKDKHWTIQEYGYFKKQCETIQIQIIDAIYEYIFTQENTLSLSRTAINNYFLKYLRTTQLYDLKKKIKMAQIFNGHA